MADHLIDEVDEALRREKLETFWKRFGQYVVAGSIGILVLTVGAVIWQNHETSRHRDWTDAMLEAAAHFDDKKYPEAASALARAKEFADDELIEVSRLWEAELALKQDNAKEAVATLDTLSSDGLYAQYASLLRLAATGEETPPKPEIFRYTALEARAARFLEDGQPEKARGVFKTLVEDAMTPQGIRERAQLLLGHLETAPAIATAPVAEE